MNRRTTLVLSLALSALFTPAVHAQAALDDREFLARTLRANAEGLGQLAAGFRRLGWSYIDGRANFLAVQVPDADATFQRLQRAGVIVRPLRGYGMAGWLRITVGNAAQNERLLTAIAA